MLRVGWGLQGLGLEGRVLVERETIVRVQSGRRVSRSTEIGRG